MKIGVLSDTHGNKKAIEEIMPALTKMDKVIHLGDHFYDMDFAKSELGDKLVTVYGNCDGGGDEKILDLEGVKTLICHGNRYHVKMGLTRIFLRAKELGVKLVLYGHTHKAQIDYAEDITLINPGAMTRFSKNGYCIIDITDGVVNARLIDLEK